MDTGKTVKYISAVFFVLLALAMLVRYFPFGFTYFPYSDDYNQYGSFYYLMQNGSGPLELYLQYGMHTARPLAGLVDVLFIAPLWNHMEIVLLLQILLHAATIPLLAYVFKRGGLPWGNVASLAYGLYPLLAESAYWINAATRIVMGVFFLALSAFLWCRFWENKRAGCMIGAAVTGLLSTGFYEQTVTFGFVLLFLLVWHQRKTRPINFPRRWYGLPLVYAAVPAAYYAVFIRLGRSAARAALAGTSLLKQIMDTLRGIALLLFKEQGYNLFSLWQVEIKRIMEHPAEYVLPLAAGLVLAAALAVVLFVSYQKWNETAESALASPPVFPAWPGTVVKIVLLFLAGFGPFFILSDTFLSLRNLFYGVPALALLAQFIGDAASRLKINDIPIGRALVSLAAAPVIFVCILLSVGSVSAFRVNARADRAVASQVIEILRGDPRLPQYRYCWVLGARYQYETHGGVHLVSSTMADWALAGLTGVLEMERYGERRLLRDNTYFLRPLMTGETRAEIDPEQDLILQLEPDGAVYPVNWRDTAAGLE